MTNIKLVTGMQEAIANMTNAIPKIDNEIFLILGGKELQMGTGKSEDSDFKRIYESEVQRLETMVLEIEADVESFRALLPRTFTLPKQNREKRGLINVIGYTMKYLFGTMDNRDMRNLNSLIDHKGMEKNCFILWSNRSHISSS